MKETAGARAADYAAVRPTLRLLLKDETYPNYMALQNQVDLPDGKPSSHVFELVAGDVIACCIEELDNGPRFVTQGDLVAWGVSADEALRDAWANVCSLHCEVNAGAHTHFVFANDSFQAARLVNTALLADRPARGMWVAVVPDRNTFFLAESDDLAGLETLARLAEKQCEEGDRLISGMPFVLKDGRWQLFEPPEAVRVPFSNAMKRFAATRWADFKAVLEQILKRNDEDVFVASLRLYEDKSTKAYWSDAVWSKGVETILLVADRIVFFEGEGIQLRVAPWADVVRVMTPSMQRLEGHPARFRVKAFPSPEQFIAMAAKAGS